MFQKMVTVQALDQNAQPDEVWAKDGRRATFEGFFNRNSDIFSSEALTSSSGRVVTRDAAEAQAFAVGQLVYTEAKMYATQYTPRMFETLLGKTISFKAGPGATSVEYQIIDRAGMGRRAAPTGDNIPYVDVAWSRKPIAVAQGTIGYFYTTEELRNAAFMQRPIEAEKIKTAFEGWRNHMNIVALQGEAQSNFTGLFNNGNVTAATRASGAVWDAATTDTILSDVIAAMSAVQQATKNNSTPNKFAVPIATYNLLLKPRSTQSDTLLIDIIKRIFPGLEIFPVTELVNLGGSGAKRTVLFNDDDENMVLHMPMPLTFLAPQYTGLRVNVPGEYKYAGLEIRRPLTAYYMDGV